MGATLVKRRLLKGNEFTGTREPFCTLRVPTRPAASHISPFQHLTRLPLPQLKTTPPRPWLYLKHCSAMKNTVKLKKLV